VLAAVLIAALIWWERRAKEPTLPPRIFATTRFKLLTASVSMQAIAMYAAWALMPIFLQVVTGTSATNTGLLLLPFVLGNTVASVITGRLVARTGHIKWAPVTGQVISGVAFFLYITMGTGTSLATASVYMGIAGFGIGMTLQTAMIMGQAVVDRRDLGTATAAIAFFRNLGQAAGAAIGLGVLNSQLNHNLDHALSPDVRRNLPADALQGSPKAIRELSPDVRHAVVNSFADALHTAFMVTFPTAVVGLVLFIFVKKMKLADRHVIETTPPPEF
jgi:MFS family permease